MLHQALLIRAEQVHRHNRHSAFAWLFKRRCRFFVPVAMRAVVLARSAECRDEAGLWCSPRVGRCESGGSEEYGRDER